MASATRDEQSTGVVFHREKDGTITATDIETGLSRGGDSRAEALTQLAEVLTLHAGGGESIEDEDEFLREIGLEPDEVKGNEELPDFLR